jgi:hypothetical protein
MGLPAVKVDGRVGPALRKGAIADDGKNKEHVEVTVKGATTFNQKLCKAGYMSGPDPAELCTNFFFHLPLQSVEEQPVIAAQSGSKAPLLNHTPD